MYKLLIVDDEPLVRRGIKSLVDFAKLNIEEVFEASNGEEALEKFKLHRPHMVLADINMPKCDGLTLSERLRAEDSEVKIALVTGYDYFDYAVQAIKLGVDDYVLKPVSRKDIEEVLIKLINKIKSSATHQELSKTVSHLINEDEEDLDEDRFEEIMQREQFSSDFSLKKLSFMLGYSSNYLSVLFKNKYGMTFQDYLINKRIEQAKLLLLSTNYKNYEIAEKVGFSDVNYFGSRFKKVVGLSPKQYKKKVGKDV